MKHGLIKRLVRVRVAPMLSTKPAHVHEVRPAEINVASIQLTTPDSVGCNTASGNAAAHMTTKVDAGCGGVAFGVIRFTPEANVQNRCVCRPGRNSPTEMLGFRVHPRAIAVYRGRSLIGLLHLLASVVMRRRVPGVLSPPRSSLCCLRGLGWLMPQRPLTDAANHCFECHKRRQLFVGIHDELFDRWKE